MKTKALSSAILSTLALSACSAPPPAAGAPGEDLGEVTAAITVVPPNVGCIDIQVAAGQRVVDRQFTVTPGLGALLTVQGLPLGAVVFSGLAYPTACAQVGPASVATYASDPLPATLKPGVRSNLELAFHAAGSASIGVDFDDAGTLAGGIVISPTTVGFPVLFCGAAPATETLSVQNLNASPITVNAKPSAGALFTVNPASFSLQPGAAQAIQVTETPLTAPHAIGFQTSSIAITTDIPGDTPHTIPASVFVGSAVFQWSTTTLTGAGTVVLKNVGNEAAGYSLTSTPQSIIASSDLTGTLAAGASVTIPVSAPTVTDTISLDSPNELCQKAPSLQVLP
jgi:hypothetical protein